MPPDTPTSPSGEGVARRHGQFRRGRSRRATSAVRTRGVHTPARAGLSRIEAIWRTIAKASIARQLDPTTDVIVLTSGHVRGGPLAVAAAHGGPIRAVVDVRRADAVDVLRCRRPPAD